ncbi:MAG: hypothetical protein IJ920_10300 [Paludibacteraceae bacterium]|nr:hypothetical protein [Paludibacteraceae bacterium]
MYYVYKFFKVDTDEIIYVGKGTGRRYKVRYGRNRLLTEMLKQYKCDSSIVKTFENERDAFSFEYNYIKSLKENGQCVCNIHCGGAGGSGEYWTPELREEYSKNNPMKAEEQRRRMSVNNPMKNEAVANSVADKKKRPVIIGDKEYASVKEAHEATGASTDAIAHWCKKGVNASGDLCRYKDEKQKYPLGERYNLGTCKGLTYKGRHYESVIDLSNDSGYSKYKLYRWLHNGFDPYGVPIRYDDDHRSLEFKRVRGANHPVIVNGERYASISEASRYLHVSSAWLGDILRGKHTSTKYICEYDNQQPS